MFFKFKIYDIHVQQKFDDLGELFTVPYDGVKWLTFNFAIDINAIKVEGIKEYVLFDDENNPINCTKVHLSDGSFVYAKVNFDTFEKNYYAFLIERSAALNKAESEG